VRPLEVIVLDVFSYFRLRLFKRRQRMLRQALLVEVAPEGFYLAARLRMIWPAADMPYPKLRQHRRELARPAPTVVLPPVVRQHFFGHPALLDSRTEHLHHVLAFLEPV
jgi:hypothetical protein